MLLLSKLQAVILLFYVFLHECSGDCKEESGSIVCPSLDSYLNELKFNWLDVVIKAPEPHKTSFPSMDFHYFARLVNLAITGFIIPRAAPIDERTYCDFSNHLNTIRLFDNKLSKISWNTFWVNFTLDILSLRKNQIEVIERGAFLKVKTNVFDLSQNLIELIENGTFNQEPDGVQSLFLGSNKILHIEEEALPRDLVVLDLQDNKILRLENDVFRDLKKLRSLSLSKNRLLKMPKLQHLVHLEELELAHNDIEEIPEGFFKNYTSLRILDLGYNKLKKVNFLSHILIKNVYEFEPRYLGVSLVFNQLINLDFGVALPVNLAHNLIILYGNIWHCDDWPKIENYLGETRVLRNKCDLQYFSSGDLPYCINATAATDFLDYRYLSNTFQTLVKKTKLCEISMDIFNAYRLKLINPVETVYFDCIFRKKKF